MAVGYGILEVAKINRIMTALQDVRTLPQELVFLNRTPVVPATDAEIIARYIGYAQIADLVADDEEAVTYDSGKLSFESTAVPNIKHGTRLTQEQINQLQAIAANPGLMNDDGYFSDFFNRKIDGLLLGIRQRMEALIIAMWIDSFSYNRLGIVLNNVSWGMPSDLKVTTSVTWDTANSATPVTDVLTQKRFAAVRYGVRYNRITMSTAAFIYMVGTAEFQSKARFILPPGTPASILPLQGTAYMQNLAKSVLEVDVLELYDARPWQQQPNATYTSQPFLPIDKVILSSTANDGNAMAMDFGNSVCTETVVSNMVPNNVIGTFPGPTRGPISYATPTSVDLNPPGVTLWGVARGFPRKYLLQATSVLSIGIPSDPIPYSNPF